MSSDFNKKSVKELQEHLKARGVTFSDLKKVELLDLCKLAAEIGLEIDPDGLIEDKESVIKEKLSHHGITVENPALLTGSQDLSILPLFSVLDIQNYLLKFSEDYTYGQERNYEKLILWQSTHLDPCTVLLFQDHGLVWGKGKI